jgi:hypothetical protein
VSFIAPVGALFLYPKGGNQLGEVIPINRAERRRQAKDAQRYIKHCPPKWQEATQQMIAAALDNQGERLLTKVLQTLRDSFGWDETKLGEFISALNAHGKEVRPSEQQPNQGNPTPGGQDDQPDPNPADA